MALISPPTKKGGSFYSPLLQCSDRNKASVLAALEVGCKVRRLQRIVHDNSTPTGERRWRMRACAAATRFQGGHKERRAGEKRTDFGWRDVWRSCLCLGTSPFLWSWHKAGWRWAVMLCVGVFISHFHLLLKYMNYPSSTVQTLWQLMSRIWCKAGQVGQVSARWNRKQQEPGLYLNCAVHREKIADRGSALIYGINFIQRSLQLRIFLGT